MSVCRWCGNEGEKAFCSVECKVAGAEMPELLQDPSELAEIRARRVSAAPAPWFLALLGGILLGAGMLLALQTQTAPSCERIRAQREVRVAATDFLENGLANIWSGEIQSPAQLQRWFIGGDAATPVLQRIFVNQQRQRGYEMVSAEITGVRLSPSADWAQTDFFVKSEIHDTERCFQGTFQWQKQDGQWLRNRASSLQAAPCR